MLVVLSTVVWRFTITDGLGMFASLDALSPNMAVLLKPVPLHPFWCYPPGQLGGKVWGGLLGG